jgi:hypothetical protein
MLMIASRNLQEGRPAEPARRQRVIGREFFGSGGSGGAAASAVMSPGEVAPPPLARRRREDSAASAADSAGLGLERQAGARPADRLEDGPELDRRAGSPPAERVDRVTGEASPKTTSGGLASVSSRPARERPSVGMRMSRKAASGASAESQAGSTVVGHPDHLDLAVSSSKVQRYWRASGSSSTPRVPGIEHLPTAARSPRAGCGSRPSSLPGSP